MTVAQFVETVFGSDVPIEVRGYDGSRAGPADAPAAVVVRSPDALRRLLTLPAELGLARAYVAGDLDLEGDLFALLAHRHRLGDVRLGPAALAVLARTLGPAGLRPLPPPPEEARLRGARHSEARDRRAISHHYDVSNDFYELLLGPTMTYSCAVWGTTRGEGLDAAQEAKYELICQKLGLRPGLRLLDVGCGWGGMVIHAARHHGVRAVGITVSAEQAALARRRVAVAGLEDRVEIRLQDYRQVLDGPYDAISSIGMFEHVGLAQLGVYLSHLHRLLRPEGRLLNHGISRPWHRERRGVRFRRRGFIDRYVFPDGELHEIGRVVTEMQRAGFEVRHLESLREHYARTLRAWVANLEQHWDDAVRLVGEGRARVWRLYLAGSAVNFEDGQLQVHQSLAVRTTADGRSGMPLRPPFEGWQPRAADREPIDLRGEPQMARSRPSQ